MLKRIRLIIFLLLLALPVGIAAAQEAGEQTQRDTDRPRIGLVLGGGGARGLAHVGVIKVLEDNQIPVDVVTGTSMGAVVGSLYASGYTIEELEDIATGLDWAEVFSDQTERSRTSFRRKTTDFGFLTDYKLTFRDGTLVLPEGIIQGQGLFLELTRLLARSHNVEKFEALPIPFRLVATDLETGKAVIMTDGNLATAVFASMAIPGFIPPVERDGHYLIDGGIVDNVPVDLAKAMGVDIIIAVNVGEKPKSAQDLGNLLDVLRQTQIIMVQDKTTRQLESLAATDILIEPDLEGFGVTSFQEAEGLSERGEQATLNALSQLLEHRLNNDDWQAHLAARKFDMGTPPTIDRIEIVQDSNLSNGILHANIDTQPGDPFDPDVLDADIDRIHGTGMFKSVTYNIIEDGEETVLEIAAEAAESSDGYFRFGIAMDSDIERDSSFQLGAAFTKPQMNEWGGEWRTEANIGDQLEVRSEFYQPLGDKQNFFVEPSIFLTRSTDDFFNEEGQRLGDIRALLLGIDLNAGMLLGRWGEIRFGARTLDANLAFSEDVTEQPDFTIHDTSLSIELNVDTLDNLSFPTSGLYFSSGIRDHSDFLGGETQLTEAVFSMFKPYTVGRHTYSFGGTYSGSWGRDSNVLGISNLGGFLNLSGYSEDELSGRHAALGFLTYYYRLNRQSALFDMPIYAGGSLEAGNLVQDFDMFDIDDNIYAGSLFLGVDSPLGPIFVGVGHNDKQETALHFSIGSIF